MREFRPVYVGLRYVDGLDLPAARCELLIKPGRLSRSRRRFYQIVGPSERQTALLSVLSPVLIHAHFGPDATHAMPLAHALGVPLVFTHHGYDITMQDHLLSHSRWLRHYLKRRARLYQAASLVLCVSRFIRDVALRKGAPPHRTVVHYIGVDVCSFTPDASVTRSDMVLFVGRLIENKGCDYLLRAMRLVQRSRPECRLVIIGDGPLRRQLEQAARSIPVKNVTFLGTQAPGVVRYWMSRARVFSVPSVTVDSGASEAFGMAFAEAQAMGLPVASFATGGVPEAVIHGATGLLAPERDIAALAHNITLLLSDGSMWQRFSEAGQRRVRELFDLRRQTAALEDLYRAVLHRKLIAASA